MEGSPNPSFFAKPLTRIGLWLITAVWLVILPIISCQEDSPTLLLTDPVRAPIAICLIDAHQFLDTQIIKARVTLVDPDTMVVTSNGLSFRTIEITGGVMSLALRRNASFNAEKPYHFTIKVEAEGYSTQLRNVLVTSDKGQYVPIFMAKLNDPPVGTASFVGAVPLDNGLVNVTAPITSLPNTVSNSNDVATENIRVIIPVGTKPIYQNESAAHSRLNFRIAYASPFRLEASRTFPGGPLVTRAMNNQDSLVAIPAAPIHFITGGWINLEMDGDGDPVTGFSNALLVTLPFPDTLPNLEPGQYYQAGDAVEVWSLDERGSWHQEGLTTIDGETGNLTATMKVTHLSTWALGRLKKPRCPQELHLDYNNKLATIGTTARYTELCRANLSTLVECTVLEYSNAGSTNTHTIEDAPEGEELGILLYSTPAPSSARLTGSTTFSCNQVTATMSIPTVANNVKVAFRIRDPAWSGTVRGEPLCSNTVWFRRCTTSCTSSDCAQNTTTAFYYGGFLTVVDSDASVDTDMKGTTTLFGPDAFIGQQYCIRLWYGDRLKGGVVEQNVDFKYDFPANVPAITYITGRASSSPNNPVNIEVSYANNTYLFEIKSGLITPLPKCN